jgi:hypothetical protein
MRASVGPGPGEAILMDVQRRHVLREGKREVVEGPAANFRSMP